MISLFRKEVPGRDFMR